MAGSVPPKTEKQQEKKIEDLEHIQGGRVADPLGIAIMAVEGGGTNAPNQGQIRLELVKLGCFSSMEPDPNGISFGDWIPLGSRRRCQSDP